MDFVDIGNAGNAADTTGYGAVDYDYRIGQHEVTIEQFMAVQAADARVGSGDEGYWHDGTRTVGVNAPASYVTMYESAMFCNWLTTGNAYEGTYQFNDSGILTNVLTRRQMNESGGLFYVLPTEDEWYKAAYYHHHLPLRHEHQDPSQL
jgi:formylglycine-generating enzyme required for sulfatase activity